MNTEVKIQVLGRNKMKGKIKKEKSLSPTANPTDRGRPSPPLLTLVIPVLPPQLYYV